MQQLIWIMMMRKHSHDTWDALAKELHAQTFHCLASKINDAMTAMTSSSNNNHCHHSHIGSLNVFGFESFVENWFEQFYVC